MGFTSIPFNRFHGTHVFEYLSLDSWFNQLFNTAMINHTTSVMKKILESYKGFQNINTLVNVSGGFGVRLNLITSKYPHIKGIYFDCPHVIENASPYNGVEHVAGDKFKGVPKGDTIFLKVDLVHLSECFKRKKHDSIRWILHDWSDKLCLKLLKNCYDAIPIDGKVIVAEALPPIVPKTTTATKGVSQFNAQMMIQCEGGKERSEAKFMELAKAVGFSGISHECFARSYWVMEFFK